MEAKREDLVLTQEEMVSEDIKEAPPARDAVIHVFTEDKGLVAYILIEAPQNGGEAPTVNAVKAALIANQITYHVDFEVMKRLSSGPVYGEKLVIARGLPPLDGKDGTTTFHIKTERADLKPKANEDGTVDFRDLGMVENVQQGQTLCTITMPTEGTPGMTVHGKEIPQKKGRPVPSYLGKNTQLSQDGTSIISLIDGFVEFNGNKINVNNTLYIKENVDNSTGNLKVACNLTIAGMVLPGFVVEADGDIEIRGAVDSATVKAGGNIIVHSGVFNSELSCGKDFRCRFIENSAVFAKGDVQAEAIVHSKVNCGKNVKVQGKFAKIVGGSCMAGQNIEADTIGTGSNVKTTLELGTDPAVIARQQELLEAVAELGAKLQKLKPLLDILQQLEAANKLSEEKRAVFEDVSFTYSTDTSRLIEAKQELEEIVQAISVKGFGRIVCKNVIFPGTTISIGRASLSVTTALQNTTLYYQDGDIRIGTAH